MGTLPLRGCPATDARHNEEPDAWPPDADDDQDVDVGDMIILFMDKINNPPAYTPRSDFDGDGDIDVGDLIKWGAFMFTTCTMVPPHKNLSPDRWYQRVSDSGSYVTWMTLTGHRHVAGFEATWNGPITNALNDWNSTPNTVYVTDYAPAEWHDVHIAVTNDCFPHIGLKVNGADPCTLGALGVTYLFDELKHECPRGDCDAQHSRPNTWWYALVLLDNDAHTGLYASDFHRQATVAHELGHAIVLGEEHSFLNPDVRDSRCGPLDDPGPLPGWIPRTVMDYDCIDPPYDILNAPQPWDSCGINHAYYDPNWGYTGC